MSGSVFGDGVTLGQAGRLQQATLPSQRWTGSRCFSVANAAIAANTLYASPFIPIETFTCDQLAVRIATGAAGNAKIGIYTSLASLLPDALVVEANADIDTTSIASATVGLTSNPTLNAGQLYWLATCFSATPTMVCWNHGALQGGGFSWLVGSSAAGGFLTTGGPMRVTRDAALVYVAASAFFPASFGAATEGAGTPGAPLVTVRKL
jgi:hypothetical protein